MEGEWKVRGLFVCVERAAAGGHGPKRWNSPVAKAISQSVVTSFKKGGRAYRASWPSGPMFKAFPAGTSGGGGTGAAG